VKSSVFASITLLATTTGAFAQFTLGSDSFELADHPTGDRLTIGTTGIPFYARNATGANLSVSIVNDAVFGSNVLRQVDTTTSAAGNGVIGVLPFPIVLANINDFITLSFKFRYLNVASATPNSVGFRFGIWGDGGTPVTADGQGSVSDNDQGYYATIGVGSAAAPGTGNLFFNEGGGTAPIGGGTDRGAITGSGGGVAINDQLVHTALFTLRRTGATTLDLSLSYDGGAAFTGTSSGAGIRTTFNEIAFNDGFVASPVQFAVDDVVVTSNVPEPATGLMCAFGFTALAVSRRRGLR
jgi:hypothetical protein